MPLDLNEQTPQVEDPNADDISHNIDTATWGEEEDWFDWNQSPWTYPYPASDYSTWYQAFQAADVKSPYYYKSSYSAEKTNEIWRVQWRGIFAKDYYFGQSPPASHADLPIKADKAIETKQWPTPWGFGLNSPMSNIYTILPGYSSAGYQPGNIWPEVSVYYYFTNFANNFGKDLYSFPMTDDWGMEVDTSKTGKPMPFVPLFMGGLGDSIQYSKKDFKGGPSVNSVYMTYPNYVPLSFNYQKIVVVPVVYCAKYNDTRDYGLEWAGPFTLGEYFDGVNWDPEQGTGTAPKKDTYPMITAVRVGRIFFGEADGTLENRRTYTDGTNLGAFLPDTLTLGGVPSARILKNGNYNTYSTKWGATDGADNWHPASGYVIDGGLISGMGQAFNNVKTFNMTLNTNITDVRRSYINETQSEGSSLPLFHHNGEYEIHCVQRHSNNGTTPQGTIGMCPIWKNPTKEKVMRDVAYLGFWFADDYDTALYGLTGEDCNDPKMHIPLFDEKGLTTGEWLSGVAAADADNAKWQDPFKSNPYDPGYTPPPPGPGPRPDPDPNPILPNSPAFTLAGRGTQCYAITPADMTEIFDDIYGRSSGSFDDLVDGLKLFGSDPMGAIISYKWYPFQYEPDPQAPIVLGTTEINAAHTYPIITNTTNSLKVFKASFWYGRDKNFVTSRNCQARLFLPFYGYYELPMPQVLSKELEVEFHYNCPDETGVWIISFGQVIYDYLECDCAIEIPLTGSNARNVRAAKVGAALSIAAQVAGTAATVAIGAATLSGGIGAARHLAEGIDVLAEEMGFGAGGLETGAYLGWSGLGTGRSAFNGMIGGMASSALGGVSGIANTIGQTIQTVNHLKVNVPFHPAADATTFLNLPMYPYIQFYTNQLIEGYNESEYRLKVGHACDTWDTLTNMPAASLCTATGIANMGTSGMEITEIQELNAILQSGFYKGTIPE